MWPDCLQATAARMPGRWAYAGLSWLRGRGFRCTLASSWGRSGFICGFSGKACTGAGERSAFPNSGYWTKLLALRSYVRAGSKLAVRWSWTEKKIKVFQGSDEQLALLAEVAAVGAHLPKPIPATKSTPTPRCVALMSRSEAGTATRPWVWRQPRFLGHGRKSSATMRLPMEASIRRRCETGCRVSLAANAPGWPPRADVARPRPGHRLSGDARWRDHRRGQFEGDRSSGEPRSGT